MKIRNPTTNRVCVQTKYTTALISVAEMLFFRASGADKDQNDTVYAYSYVTATQAPSSVAEMLFFRASGADNDQNDTVYA